jgi:zinc D-Ala-D-Ala dipeptidase
MSPSIPCERIPTHPDFRALANVADLRVDLRYATALNFMGRDMYSPLDCAWAHREAVDGLMQAMAWLARQRPRGGAHLCVLDALRPQRVQELMWAALQGTPLTEYLAPPERGSIHSFGMAIDATLIDADGQEFDMGTSFDDMTELSHPALEAAFLRAGALDDEQLNNRHLLREAMRRGGFHGIDTEWWHFDCGDRAVVRATYVRVL